MMSDRRSTIRLKGLSKASREELLGLIAELLSNIESLEQKGMARARVEKEIAGAVEKDTR